MGVRLSLVLCAIISLMAQRIMVPVGIPGCGKSTYTKGAQRIYEENGLRLEAVSSDAIRIEQAGSLRAFYEQRLPHGPVFDEFHRRIDRALSEGFPVIADATNLSAQSRANLLNLAAEHDCGATAILFDNVADAVVRNKARGRADNYVHDAAMIRMIGQFAEARRVIRNESFIAVVAAEDGPALKLGLEAGR